MNILITGGNGFIGGQLARRLAEKGEHVSQLDIHFDPASSDSRREELFGDVTRYNDVKKAVADKDFVFHLAAVSRVVWGEQNPSKCWKTNLLGTLNLLEACRKTGSKPVIIYASSREVYGDPAQLPVKEEHPKMPKSVYGASKLAAEELCASYQRAFSSRVITVRFSNVYGSERDLMDRVTPKFMVKAMRNEDIVLYGGDQILDFCFIDDVVSGLVRVLARAQSNSDEIIGQDFNFVTGRGTSVAQLAQLVKKTCGSTSRIVKSDSKYFDVRKFMGSPEKCSRVLDFRLETKLENGLKMLRARLAPTLQKENKKLL